MGAAVNRQTVTVDVSGIASIALIEARMFYAK